MATFKEANQVRLALKMKLSQYCWYTNSGIVPDVEGYCVVIYVSTLDNRVRKIIPTVIDSVSIKTEVN